MGRLNGSATGLRLGCAPNQPVWYRGLTLRPRPVIYVEKLRIEAVRRKLELTSLRLGEIAEQCGFISSDVMTRRFRFHLKVKPLDYRARFRSSIGPA
jgi:AraC-like DNA-binding protein